MTKVGILYDNISGNTGDVAIGLSLKKILQDIGVEFDELFPGNFNPSDYDTIIIGGGHLIRPSPDFFYDKFKITGKHILNAMGILDSPKDLDYLNDYKYITVRSTWDKERLSYIKKNVQVIPCTTMLLDDLDKIPENPVKPSIGIHILPNIFNENDEKRFIEWISSLPYTVYFLPITHYNQDYVYMRDLSLKIKDSVLLPLMDPLEIFTFIGKLNCFISCSLHGGIFAFKHNIPFILFNYNEKMFFFMKDRKLEQYTFTNLDEMKTALQTLLSDNPDYSEKISEDLEILQKHIGHLRGLLQQSKDRKDSALGDSERKFSQIQNLQSQVRSLELQLQESKELAKMAEQTITDMQRSIVWQTTMKFDKYIVKRTMPQGSKRRKFYELSLKGGRILANEGWGKLYFNFKNYIKFIRLTRNMEYFHTKRAKPLILEKKDFKPIDGARIAIVIHVYYIDMFEEICSYLINIPTKHTLLISTNDEKNRTVIANRIRGLPLVERAEIRVVENRGRDIAPLIVDFSRSIRSFDYICHIHTKKSLRMGSDQTEWRTYLYDILLGSKERVKAILSAFQVDKSIGLIFPESFRDIPYWAHTWLGNKGLAIPLLNKLGMRFDPDEYIDAPMGSMFWAKREAIEPLLDLGLTREDFPEEHGQTDCTLHHTIERLFGFSAQSRGLKYAVIDDKKAHVFRFHSAKNLQHYFILSFETKIRNQLQNIRVISFDIFDTLMVRPFASPDMVFEYIQEKAIKDFNIRDFRQIRKDSENIVRKRKKFANDVKISEIYAAFAEIANISESLANQLLELEVNTEKSILRPREQVIKLAKEAEEIGKRIIFVSDTYFEKNNLERILLANGIDFYDELYLSSEIGKRKDRGDIWDYIIDSENITKRDFLHVGDNEQSDIHVLTESGFLDPQPIHIMKPSILFRQSEIGDLLFEIIKPYRGWRENLLFGMIANLFCSDPYPKKFFDFEEPLSDPFAFGYVIFGPIIFNFMSWLIKVSKNDHVKELKFIARDGFLLNQAYNTIINHPKISKTIMPNGSYFICSRRAAMFAALETKEDIHEFLGRHFEGTLRSFFEKRLNISDISAIEDKLGNKALEKVISLPDDYDRVFDNFAKVFDIVAKQAEEERESMLQYCNNEGFLSDEVGLVDIGYSGSTQKALAKLLRRPLKGYYFVTDDLAYSLISSGSICRAYFGEFIKSSQNKLPIKRHNLLIESVLTAPFGQLLYFNEISGKVVPNFKEPGVSQDEFPTIARIQEGILEFTKDMLDLFGSEALDIEFPKEVLQDCYEAVIAREIKIGDLETVLSVEDHFCGNEELSVLETYNKLS